MIFVQNCAEMCKTVPNILGFYGCEVLIYAKKHKLSRL